MNAGTCALSERLISSQENLSGRESGSSRTNSLSASRAPTSVTFSSEGKRGKEEMEVHKDSTKTTKSLWCQAYNTIMKHTYCGILTQFRNWLRVPELMWLDLFIHGQLLEYLLQVFGRDVPNGGRVCCYHGDTPCSCSTTLLVFVFFVLLLLRVYRGRETDKSPCNTVEYTEHRRKSAGVRL